MKYVMVKDRFYIAREEVRELERLLQEARIRQRYLLKKENLQIFKFVGFSVTQVHMLYVN